MYSRSNACSAVCENSWTVYEPRTNARARHNAFKTKSLLNTMAEPYALNDDGTAKDAKAFREALRADKEKMEALKEEPDVLKVVLGDDLYAFQELIKSVYQVRKDY